MRGLQFVGIRIMLEYAWISSVVAWNTRRQYIGLTDVHSYLAKTASKQNPAKNAILTATKCFGDEFRLWKYFKEKWARFRPLNSK